MSRNRTHPSAPSTTLPPVHIDTTCSVWMQANFYIDQFYSGPMIVIFQMLLIIYLYFLFQKYWKQMQLSTIQLIVTHRNERFIHLKLASKFSIRWLSSQVAPCRSCVQRMYCSAAAVYKHYLYEIYNGDTIRLTFILLVRDLQPT